MRTFAREACLLAVLGLSCEIGFEGICDKGNTRACVCPDEDVMGIEACRSSGEWGDCSCGDPDLQTSWVQISNPSEWSDCPYDIAVDATGVYIAGSDKLQGPSDGQWRIEKRRHSDGELIWVQNTNPSSDWDRVLAVAVSGTGLYVAGRHMADGSCRTWHIEKRSLLDGSLIWSVEDLLDGISAIPANIVVGSGGVYVSGNHKLESRDSGIRVERRSPDDGSLLWVHEGAEGPHFGYRSGLALFGDALYSASTGAMEPPARGDWCRIEKFWIDDGLPVWVQQDEKYMRTGVYADDVVVDASGIYLAGNDVGNFPHDQWRIDKRSHADGEIIWSTFSESYDLKRSVSAVAISNSELFVAGSQKRKGTPENRRAYLERRSLASGELLGHIVNEELPDHDYRGVAANSSGIYLISLDYAQRAEGQTDDSQWRIERVPR